MAAVANRMAERIVASNPALNAFFSKYREPFRESMGYRKWGFVLDDLYYETPAIEEAIARLPSEELQNRHFRTVRAIDCDMKHKYLDVAERPTKETDLPYLAPYIFEVIDEIEERKEWDRD